jgi:aryl-alcohol dehydrogenase-like predicted oxidoreductase
MPIERWATECQQLYGGQPEWANWWKRFAQTLPAVFEEIARYVGSSQQAVSDEVRAQVEGAGYPPSGESLSRVANNVLLNLDGVSSVLVGMRRPEYVDDTMGAVALDPVDSLAILTRFRQMVASESTATIQ